MTPVRIAAWNCCGAAITKLPILLERLEPDVAVLPEFATHPVMPDLFSGTSLVSAGMAGRALAGVAGCPGASLSADVTQVTAEGGEVDDGAVPRQCPAGQFMVAEMKLGTKPDAGVWVATAARIRATNASASARSKRGASAPSASRA